MYRNIIGGGAALLMLVACAGDPDAELEVQETPPAAEPAASMDMATETLEAQATFINDQGTEIGTATLTEVSDGVRIDVDLAFLQAGERGFHIHETGTCETPDFQSAGGHFNPTDAAHGFEAPEGPHAGDLENLEVETDDGTARGVRTAEMVTLERGLPNSLFDTDGSALVVHSGPDDYSSQPSGDSGSRIACGVIEPV
ncbi:MAG: superoxide dismutase family protein [Gemmatimonadota bacterium]